MSFNFGDEKNFTPLAARMRPQTLDEYVGQSHLLASEKPLRKAIQAGLLHSMILWGPPGTGKTTLAEVIAHYAHAQVVKISAVTSGVKDIREAVEKAREFRLDGRQTILFVDEVHRFNKSQQDAFLPHIEDGTITFIGATTENPSFELNNALLSRVRVYKLTSLHVEEIIQVIDQALTDKDKGLGRSAINCPEDVKIQLAKLVTGDARMALNYLELMHDMAPVDELGNKLFNTELLSSVVGEKQARFDNKGDIWYDLISAVHKSVRGSDPDAALYWYARIITAGGDPLYVARRLLAIASEDIGNADPRGMQVAVAAWDCYTKVGAAEGERAIAQAIVYLACAPKSNAVYKAWNQALTDAKANPEYEVPLHLRNAPTQLMKELGYHEGYRYAHDEPNAYAAGECYFPEQMQNKRYYYPSSRGLEIKISEKLAYLADLDHKSQKKRYEND